MKRGNSLLRSLWVLFVVLFLCGSIEAVNLLEKKSFDFPPGLVHRCVEADCGPLQKWINNQTALLEQMCNKSWTDCSDKATLVNHLLWDTKANRYFIRVFASIRGYMS